MSVVKKDYLICYDISSIVDEDGDGIKRLSYIAKYLEKVSFRIQYSIFLLPKTTNVELENIINSLSNIIDKEQDDLRIYTIKNSGLKSGIAVDLNQPFILV